MEPVPAIGPVVAVLETYLHRRTFVKIEKRERSIGDFRISLLSVALATLEALKLQCQQTRSKPSLQAMRRKLAVLARPKATISLPTFSSESAKKTSLAWHISCTEANPEPLPFSQLAPRVGPMSSTPNSLTYFGQSCTSHGSHSYLRLLPFAATAEKHVLCRPIASLSPCTRQVKAFCASFMWRHFAASAHA